MKLPLPVPHLSRTCPVGLPSLPSIAREPVVVSGPFGASMPQGLLGAHAVLFSGPLGSTSCCVSFEIFSGSLRKSWEFWLLHQGLLGACASWELEGLLGGSSWCVRPLGTSVVASRPLGRLKFLRQASSCCVRASWEAQVFASGRLVSFSCCLMASLLVPLLSRHMSSRTAALRGKAIITESIADS